MTDLTEVLARAIAQDKGYYPLGRMIDGVWVSDKHLAYAGACLAALDAAGYQIVPKEKP